MTAIDLSPCKRFQNIHRMTDRNQILGYETYSSVGTPLIPIAAFYGPAPDTKEPWRIFTFRTMEEAVNAFNKSFSDFCVSLPDDAQLFWRREATVENHHDFESNQHHWKCGCRVHVYKGPAK